VICGILVITIARSRADHDRPMSAITMSERFCRSA